MGEEKNTKDSLRLNETTLSLKIIKIKNESMAKKKKKQKTQEERFENLTEDQKMEILSSAAKLRKAHKMKTRDRSDWKRNLERGRDHSGRGSSRMTRTKPDVLEDWTRKAMDLADNMNTLNKTSERELFEGKVQSISRGGGILRCQHGQITFFLKAELAMLQKTGVSVGEEIFYSLNEDGTALVERIKKRRSILSRPDPLRPKLERVIAVNIDYICIVSSIDSPIFNPFFIDRILIAARQSGAKTIIALNKMDLIDDGNKSALEDIEYYRTLDVETVMLSAENCDGVENLKDIMKGKTSVFVGMSGVGKSSLLNAISPDLDLKTCETREKAAGRGRHTTVMSTMHYLDDMDLCIIDTPGVREFNLMDVNKEELKYYFPEFVELEPCRFSNCKHVNEAGCVVLDKVESGEIYLRRYDSYLRMLDTVPKAD